MNRSLFGSIRDRPSRSHYPYAGSSSSTSGRSPGKTAGASKAPPAPQDLADAPPAYSYSASLPPAPLIVDDDDKYAFLASFDTVFIIDDSSSMLGASWREVAAALRSITPICTAYDGDGVDLYFLNHRSGGIAVGAAKPPGGYYGITSPAVVEDIFARVQPRGTTPTGARLQTVLRPYLARLAACAADAADADDADALKPVNIIVITDGRPTDDPEAVLVQSARRLDQLQAPPHQVGVQFFQVGDEYGAREALRELDDDLAQQGIRDMVDTVTWDGAASPAGHERLTADGILKAVLGAVVRRLDRWPVGGSSSRRR